VQSRWIHLKEKAVALRKEGKSIVFVESSLGIPRSTLSGWFRSVRLSREQKEALHAGWKLGLSVARRKAVNWHNSQKKERLDTASENAKKVLSKIDLKDRALLDLTLAMLYFGEGSKKQTTGIGNSDPLVLKFFIHALKILYPFCIQYIKCELHLRMDQDDEEMKSFWSVEIGVPVEHFRKTSYDKRTQGKPTYGSYKGVCIVNCGNVAIQRELVYLSRSYCEAMLQNAGG